MLTTVCYSLLSILFLGLVQAEWREYEKTGIKIEFIEIHDELAGKGEQDADITIGVVTDLRAQLMGKAKVISADKMFDHGSWYQLVAIRCGIHAFGDKAVLEPPTDFAPLKYKVVFIDTCETAALCEPGASVQVSYTYAKTLLLGGNQRKPANLLLVGPSVAAKTLIPWANAMGLPALTYTSRTPLAASAYPYYFHGGESAGDVSRAVVFAMSRTLGYTRISLWLAKVSVSSVMEEFMQLANEGGETLSQHFISPATMDGMMANPNDPKIAEYDILYASAKDFNAHYHFSYLSHSTPGYDVMHYLAYKGLIGPGYLWVHGDLSIPQFYPDYVSGITQIYTILFGSKPWTMQMPFDGSLHISVKWKGPKVEEVFEPWLFSLGPQRHLIFEDWWLKEMTQEHDLFHIYTGSERIIQPAAAYGFEMMWASLYIMNKLALQTGGTDFDASDVTAEFAALNFDGLGGPVETITPSGNSLDEDNFPRRLCRFQIFQYRQCEKQNDTSYQLWDYEFLSQRKITLEECEAIPACKRYIDEARAEDVDRYADCGAGGECPSIPAHFHDDPVFATTPLKLPAPNMGEMVVWAEVAEDGAFDIQGEYVGHSCSRKLPPDFDLPCPAGEMYDRVQGECKICSAGRFSAAVASTECLECPKGTFTATDGESLCVQCQPGSYTVQARATACGICSAGTISTVLAAEGCSECSPGTFTGEPGGVLCKSCARGTFAPASASTQCTSCAKGLTTGVLGSQEQRDCRCAEGTYSKTVPGSCQPCKEGMFCPFGGTTAAWFNHNFEQGHPLTYELDMDILEGVYPLVRRGFYSTPAEPLSIFICESVLKCPGGDPGACGKNLVGQSCQHCSAGFTWDGKACVKCGANSGNEFIFPVLPLLLPAIVLPILQKLMFAPLSSQETDLQRLGTLCFIILNFFSSVNILGSAAVDYSKVLGFVMDSKAGGQDGEVADTVADTAGNATLEQQTAESAQGDAADDWNAAMVFALSNDLLSLFDLACAGYGSFQKMVSFKLCFPAVIGAWAVLLALGSRQLARVLQRPVLELDFDIMISTYLSLMLTFFNAVMVVSLTLFKCSPNPNGTASLIADIAVICYQDDWKSMLGLSITAVVVYCIGYATLLLRVMIVAPARIQQESFRKRYGFIFSRYRPDLYYWTLFFVAKNVLQNMSFVMFKSISRQIYWFMAVSMLYMVILANYLPYRFRAGTVLDVCANGCVVILCSVVSNFQMWVDRDDLSYFGAALAFVPFVVCYTTLFKMVWKGMQDRVAQQIVDPKTVMWDTPIDVEKRDLQSVSPIRQMRATMEFLADGTDDILVKWIKGLDFANRGHCAAFVKAVNVDGVCIMRSSDKENGKGGTEDFNS